MEVKILQADGFDTNSVVSMRSGKTRRQAPVTHNRSFRFPSLSCNACPLQIDVMRPIASGRLEATAGAEVHYVRFPTTPGDTPKTMTLAVKDLPGRCHAVPLETLDCDTHSDAERDTEAKQLRDAAAKALSLNEPQDDTSNDVGEIYDPGRLAAVKAARSYLERTSLLGFMQEQLRYVLREMPEDPISFLAEHFTKTAEGQREKSNTPPMVEIIKNRDSLDDDDKAFSLNESSSKSKVVGVTFEDQASRGGQTADIETQKYKDQQEWQSHENQCFRDDIERLSQLCKEKGVAVGENSWLETPHAMNASTIEELRMEHVDLRRAMVALCEELAGQIKEDRTRSQRGKRMTRTLKKAKSLFEKFSDSDVENETFEQPHVSTRPRSNAVSSDVFGDLMRRPVAKRHVDDKTEAQVETLVRFLRGCPIFSHLDSADDLKPIVRDMPVVTYDTGSEIFHQGDEGNSLLIVLRGSVGLYSYIGARQTSKVFVQSLAPGKTFGELAMLWRTPRSLTAIAQEECEIGVMSRELYNDHIVRRTVAARDYFVNCVRNSTMLEMLSFDQMACLADVATRERFNADDTVIQQGDEGNCFFILLQGECKVVVKHDNDVQEHRRYHAGDMFGERALINEHARREASIIACGYVEVLAVGKAKFERLIGPIKKLKEVQYVTDPRACIAQFFAPGDHLGPLGASENPEKCANGGSTTRWFVVYRPTSRDAIARMLSRTGVGKGLNVKGKSAKANRLSGYVPFLQISMNDHKKKVEKPPADGWIQVFWRSDSGRAECEHIIKAGLENGVRGLPMASDCLMMPIDKYEGVYGLMIPEAVIHHFFIHKPDLTHPVGWETGRVSEPAFMDMNLNVLRSTKADPRVVLYQADAEDPMNPHGFLMAYAEEKFVKPVVSDFDTLLVGSTGMKYAELPKEQVALAKWSLKKTEEIFENPLAPGSWTTRWLQILKDAIQDGELQLETPKYGFGDASSYHITSRIVQATKETGAVRHGAECFNYVFPQELDSEFLVIWDGFSTAWEYYDEDDLRQFLTERAQEGYTFPLNPIWAVRDMGWYEVLQALRDNPVCAETMKSWYPPEDGMLDQIDRVHEAHPDGFAPDLHASSFRDRSKSVMNMGGGDLSCIEKVDIALEQVRKEAVAKKLRNAAKALSCLGMARRLTRMMEEGMSRSPSMSNSPQSPQFASPVLPLAKRDTVNAGQMQSEDSEQNAMAGWCESEGGPDEQNAVEFTPMNVKLSVHAGSINDPQEGEPEEKVQAAGARRNTLFLTPNMSFPGHNPFQSAQTEGGPSRSTSRRPSFL